MSLEGIYEEQLARARPLLLEEEPTVVVETSQGDEKENPVQPDLVEKRAGSMSSLFRNSDAHPLVLDLALLQKYQADWLRWEYETLAHRIPQDFDTPTVADVNLEKLQACKTLHLVDDFWTKWEVFNACVAAFNGSFADFQRLQVHSVPEFMLAVDIANRIRADVAWSPEVSAFLSVGHLHDGVLVPTAPLEFVKVSTEGLPGDYAEVAKRWPAVRASGQAPKGDSIEDEQLRRMLVCWRYLAASRARFQEQLPLLKNV